MSDYEGELEGIRHAATELLPKLAERLARSGLGELEVRQGQLRVRVAAAPTPADPPTLVGPTIRVAGVAPKADGGTPRYQEITSPAVGFFAFADGLGPGLAVDKGDALGHVEMLGVRHDVRAPRRGTVRNLVTEAGEPVEYGQLLIELEPGE